MANVFYRAGFIENWGRGIEKICKACDELGAERPRYEVLGRGIRIFFKGLDSALFHNEQDTDSTLEQAGVPLEGERGTLEHPNGTLGGTLEKPDGTLDFSDDTMASEIIILIRQNPQITQAELVEQLNTSLRTVKRITKRLSEKGIMVRKGGKRFGYWEVL